MKHPLRWSLVLALVPLLGWWSYGLFDLDEGFYGAVAAEMNRRGEWIIPYFNGSPWFEKPVLLYWAAKPCLLIFGDVIGPRIPCVIANLLLYAIVGWYVNRRSGTTAAVASVLILSSCILVAALGRMMMTDPLLDLALAAAMITFWESLEGDARWRIASAACLGLGVLAKGPIAGILFLPAVVFTFWRFPELRPKFKGSWLMGVIVFALVVCSWYLPAYLRAGSDFVQKFLIEQNFGRFSGTDKAHVYPGLAGLVFYVPICLLGFAPWIFFVPAAIRSTATKASMKGYVLVWMATVFVFFTVTSAKLAHYVLPMGPPMAILVGPYLAEKWDNTLSAKRLVLPIGWLCACAVLLQTAFAGYYYGIHIGSLDSPGFHFEAHRLARFVREHAKQSDEIVEYQMGSQERKLPGGKPRIQENSQPSTLLYLNRNVSYVEDLAKVTEMKERTWILTRWNRISDSELALAGGGLTSVNTGFPQDMYRLYIWQPIK